MNRVEKISGRIVVVLMMKGNSLVMVMMLVVKVIGREVRSREVNVTSMIAHLGGQHCQPTGSCPEIRITNSNFN